MTKRLLGLLVRWMQWMHTTYGRRMYVDSHVDRRMGLREWCRQQRALDRVSREVR